MNSQRLVGALVALVLLTLSVSAASAQAELVPGLTFTARSGFAGTQTTTLGEPSGEHAIGRITAGERSNRPCYLNVTKYNINSWDDPIDDLWIDCPSVAASTVESAGWFTGDGLFVYGVAVCTNNNANERLKGVMVYGGLILSTGEVVHAGLPDWFDRPNCDIWHNAVFCPEGQVATKVRLHHTGDEINGLSLGCRAVR